MHNKPISYMLKKILKIFKINKRGQFFSPDLMIATLIFVFSLIMFISSSTFIFNQVNYFTFISVVDEAAHNSLESIIKSEGLPVNWNTKEIDEIRFFGIAKENNVIDENKLISLINHLDNNYETTKEMLGMGKFDFKLRVIDFNGSTKYESVNVTDNVNQFTYSRIVFLNNKQVILQGVVFGER